MKYKTIYKHLQDFLAVHYHVKDVTLKELMPAFISDFEIFLRTDKHCCINNERFTCDPFREYKIKKEEMTRSFLTKDEIHLLMDRKLKNTK